MIIIVLCVYRSLQLHVHIDVAACFATDVVIVMENSASGDIASLKSFVTSLASSIQYQNSNARFALVLVSNRGLLVTGLASYRSAISPKSNQH